MSQREYEIYPVDRALDAIADQPGIRPLRVHRVAIPLHVAEVTATVTAREPFDLLDRYVGLAIADGGFRSLAEMAEYLGITPDIVHRVLRFLGEIGHVTGVDGALELTPLGMRAVRDETRYTPKEDRLKLYFDGVRCSPLPERFYGRGVRVLDRESAHAQHGFTLFDPATGFTNDAVTALAARPDRAATACRTSTRASGSSGTTLPTCPAMSSRPSPATVTASCPSRQRTQRQATLTWRMYSGLGLI